MLVPPWWRSRDADEMARDGGRRRDGGADRGGGRDHLVREAVEASVESHEAEGARVDVGGLDAVRVASRRHQRLHARA